MRLRFLQCRWYPYRKLSDQQFQRPKWVDKLLKEDKPKGAADLKKDSKSSQRPQSQQSKKDPRSSSQPSGGMEDSFFQNANKFFTQLTRPDGGPLNPKSPFAGFFWLSAAFGTFLALQKSQ